MKEEKCLCCKYGAMKLKCVTCALSDISNNFSISFLTHINNTPTNHIHRLKADTCAISLHYRHIAKTHYPSQTAGLVGQSSNITEELKLPPFDCNSSSPSSYSGTNRSRPELQMLRSDSRLWKFNTCRTTHHEIKQLCCNTFSIVVIQPNTCTHYGMKQVAMKHFHTWVLVNQ